LFGLVPDPGILDEPWPDGLIPGMRFPAALRLGPMLGFVKYLVSFLYGLCDAIGFGGVESLETAACFARGLIGLTDAVMSLPDDPLPVPILL